MSAITNPSSYQAAPPDHSGETDRARQRLASVVAIAGSVLFFAGKVWFGWPEPSSGLIASLFGLPLLLQIIVLAYLLRPAAEAPLLGFVYSATTVIGFGSYLWCWMFYRPEGPLLWWWERWPVCFAIALGLVVLAASLACISHHTGPHDSWVGRLRVQTAKHPLASGWFFFGVFLCVTYLLAFSLSFDDRSRRAGVGPGGGKPGATVAHSEGLHVVPRNTNVTSFPSAQGPSTKIVATFVFDEPSATINAEPRDDSFTDRPSRPPLSKTQIANNIAFRTLVDAVLKCSVKPSERIMITILGHANSRRLRESTTSYISNFELSTARAGETYRRLKDLFEGTGRADLDKWASANLQTEAKSRRVSENIDWNVRSAADEAISLQMGTASPSATPSVEVTVEDIPNHLTARIIAEDVEQPALLDYVYFAIYTITTTGYGDIMPVSDVAKFLVSVTNILEVFFLVIFFNVIVSQNVDKIAVARESETPRGICEIK